MHSWDIGATLEGNPSVCTKWGVTADPAGRDNIYLTDVVRVKLEIPDVRAAIKAHDKLEKPDLIVIIDHRGAGIGVRTRSSVELGYRHLYAASKDGTSNESKIDRFGKALLYMYDGVVKYPVSGPFRRRRALCSCHIPWTQGVQISLTVSHSLSLSRRTR